MAFIDLGCAQDEREAERLHVCVVTLGEQSRCGSKGWPSIVSVHREAYPPAKLQYLSVGMHWFECWKYRSLHFEPAPHYLGR